MSPKQCNYNPTLAVEYSAPASDGDVGSPLETIRMNVYQMYEHVDWVNELESLATIPYMSARSMVRVRRLRRDLIDSLLRLSHTAHRFLRHGDPLVRRFAELLTTETALLIGRLYDMAWVGSPLMVV
ncbi:unnamed protein product [Aphis gossypii]|uniref:Uncharacterized protein n=1 Tax=Aphis gossypii TaxID=80765 RepID=A0A9P0J8P3_APHGO|nr:unnamed protein product [Aphis gossypii]